MQILKNMALEKKVIKYHLKKYKRNLINFFMNFQHSAVRSIEKQVKNCKQGNKNNTKKY